MFDIVNVLKNVDSWMMMNMTDCGAVHDWIDDHHFGSFHEVVDYIRTFDQRWGQTNGNLNALAWGALWDCVDEYDFDTELLVLKVRFHTKKGVVTRMVLRRRLRETKVFTQIALDPSTKLRIRELINQGY